jgi:hypothetical protein
LHSPFKGKDALRSKSSFVSFFQKKFAHIIKGILPLRALLKRGCKDGLAIPEKLPAGSNFFQLKKL